jgi:predicted 2-oxoglutarate/Fe(II)-dependent dioxygenase YbiX
MSAGLVTALDPGKPVYNGHELLLVENYLNSEICQQLISFAEQQAGSPAPVGNVSDGYGKVANTQDKAFIADRIDLMDIRPRKMAIELLTDAYRNRVDPHYGVETEWFEIPHILRYTSGGKYIYHSDSENWDQEQKRWIKGADRDYSCIIYLNDNFTGGNLALPYLNIRLHPRTGLLIVFPSDHRFTHAAEETLSGLRYALVTWGVRKGSVRVMSAPPPHIVRF